jgi:hypothetical protein
VDLKIISYNFDENPGKDGDGMFCGCALNISNKPISKAVVILYNCNIAICSPSSELACSIEQIPLKLV